MKTNKSSIYGMFLSLNRSIRGGILSVLPMVLLTLTFLASNWFDSLSVPPGYYHRWSMLTSLSLLLAMGYLAPAFAADHYYLMPFGLLTIFVLSPLFWFVVGISIGRYIKNTGLGIGLWILLYLMASWLAIFPLAGGLIF